MTKLPAELATEHLFAIGCRRIAHIRGPEVSTATGRLRGYRRVLARHGLGVFPGYVPSASGGDANSDARGHEVMQELLRLDPRPDGVFCYNDPTALGAINATLEAGLRVPEDIAVIGCGNVHYDASLRVPLSSIDQQSAAIGERTAKLALSLDRSESPAQAPHPSPSSRDWWCAPRLHETYELGLPDRHGVERAAGLGVRRAAAPAPGTRPTGPGARGAGRPRPRRQAHRQRRQHPAVPCRGAGTRGRPRLSRRDPARPADPDHSRRRRLAAAPRLRPVREDLRARSRREWQPACR